MSERRWRITNFSREAGISTHTTRTRGKLLMSGTRRVPTATSVVLPGSSQVRSIGSLDPDTRVTVLRDVAATISPDSREVMKALIGRRKYEDGPTGELRQLLKEAGVQIKEIADYLGVSVSNVMRDLNGSNLPSIAVFKEMLSFLPDLDSDKREALLLAHRARVLQETAERSARRLATKASKRTGTN